MADTLSPISADLPTTPRPPQPSMDILDVMRMLFGFDPARSPLSRLGPQGQPGPLFGVPPGGAKPTIPTPAPAGQAQPALESQGAGATGAKPATTEQQQINLIQEMQRQQDMFRDLVPKTAPAILGVRG